MIGEGRRLIDLARERNIVLRLLGGLAIRLLTPELPPRTRVGQDLDFGSVKSSRKPLTEMLAEQGYVGDRNFNALYGDKQLYFAHGEHGHAVDVMIDRLHMCHTVAFADRATLMPYTLSPVDLLLSKLQIVELNEKDLDDCLRLLVSFDLAESGDPDVDRPAGHRLARRRRLGVVEDDQPQPGADQRCPRRRGARDRGRGPAEPARRGGHALPHTGRDAEEPALEAARPDRRAQALVRPPGGDPASLTEAAPAASAVSCHRRRKFSPTDFPGIFLP